MATPYTISYAKWNPSGNTTLFFKEQPPASELRIKLVQRALKRVPKLSAEQAGFIWENNLEMAGGEFCLNATAALAADLLQAKNCKAAEFSLKVSGWPTNILAKASLKQKHVANVELTLERPKFSLTALPFDQIYLVKFDGISHLLINKPCKHELAYPKLMNLILQAKLEAEPCVGAIWWEELNLGHYKITPLVFVREIQTCVFEHACGSGSLALAAYLTQKCQMAEQELKIEQPSHATISCQIAEKTITIKSQVEFLDQGRLTLDL